MEITAKAPKRFNKLVVYGFNALWVSSWFAYHRRRKRAKCTSVSKMKMHIAHGSKERGQWLKIYENEHLMENVKICT